MYSPVCWISFEVVVLFEGPEVHIEKGPSTNLSVLLNLKREGLACEESWSFISHSGLLTFYLESLESLFHFKSLGKSYMGKRLREALTGCYPSRALEGSCGRVKT